MRRNWGHEPSSLVFSPLLSEALPADRRERRLASNRGRNRGRLVAAQSQLPYPARRRGLHHGHLPHRQTQG
jgi:hypothetical protein